MTTSDAELYAIAWTALKARRGEEITYHSGDESVAVTAVFTRPVEEQVDGDENIVFEKRQWDVLLDPQWPDSAPVAFTDYQPSPGDLVERADGTLFRVTPETGSDPAWRWSGSEHTWRRVFIAEE